MSRTPRYRGSHQPSANPAPSEALLFARAILGESAISHATEAGPGGHDWEQLEFLASISPEHERKLRDLARIGRSDAIKRGRLDWAAEISIKPDRRLDGLLREEAAAAEVRERARRCLENLQRLRRCGTNRSTRVLAARPTPAGSRQPIAAVPRPRPRSRSRQNPTP